MESARLEVEEIYLDYFYDSGKLMKKWTKTLLTLKIERKQLYRAH